jgi:uncharacterized protein (DUF697 family)
MAQVELKLSPSETLYAAVDVRAFITDALNTAPAVEIVQELLVTHVEGKLLHPSVVQEELTAMIQDIVGAATHADWIAITTGLINDAREALLDDEPATACAR